MPSRSRKRAAKVLVAVALLIVASLWLLGRAVVNSSTACGSCSLQCAGDSCGWAPL